MESWLGLGRRVGRGALGRLDAARKPGPGEDARRADENGHHGTNGISDAGKVSTGQDSGAVPADAAAAAAGAAAAGAAAAGAAQADAVEPARVSAPAQSPVSAPRPARQTEPGSRASMAEYNRVPSWLQTGAAWSWRLLLLALAVYLIARAIGVLYIVVVPCTAALLLTALLQPLTARLRRAGLPGLAATWCTLLIAAAVVGGLVLLVTNRVTADYPTLVSETRHTTAQVESWLSGPPFHVKNSSVKNALNNIPSYLSKHKALVEGTVLTGGRIAAEFFGGLVLMLFVMFFLIKDGERIWTWLLGALRPETARRVDRAGRAGWLAVVYYMRGTVAVAAIHALVIGLTLYFMDAPLVIPLAVLVFVAAFVPLVGLLVAGAIAFLVVLAAKGWVDAVILLVVLIVEDQLEGHLLQPQVVGRVIRLHPLAIILALAVGGVLAGIAGAVVAVPIVAVITRALPELRRSEPGPDEAGDP